MEITIPLTLYQKRFWIEWQLDPQATRHNTPLIFKLKGKLNFKALENALRFYVQKFHDQANSYFLEQDLKIFSVEKSDKSFQLEKKPFTESDFQQACYHVFQLAQQKPYFFQLFEIAATEHMLVLNFHHIITDGKSARLFMVLFKKLYLFFKIGGVKPHRSASYFEEYALREHALYPVNTRLQDFQYWYHKLKNKPLGLPFIAQFPEKPETQGQGHTFKFTKALSSEILRFSRRHKTSAFIFFLTVYTLYLSRVLDRDEIILTYPVDVRLRNFQQTLGCFTNNVPFYYCVNKKDSFLDCLEKITQIRKADRVHQRYPLSDLIQLFKKKGLVKTDNYFNISIAEAFLNTESFQLDTLKIDSVFFQNKFVQNDLHLAYQYDGVFRFYMQFRKQIWDKNMAKRFAKHFELFVQYVLKKPNASVLEIDFLSLLEKENLLKKWNNTKINFRLPENILTLFEKQLLNTPDKIACSMLRKKLTFSKLEECSNKLYFQLHAFQGKHIAILLEKSLELVVSIFAVLKLGKPIILIDLQYPNRQIERILESAECTLVLTNAKFKEKLPKRIKTKYIDLKRLQSVKITEDISPIKSERCDSFYIMYTSGTTNKPKGVIISQDNFLNLLWDFKKRFKKSLEHVLSITAVASDLYFLELFLPILFGGQHEILPENYKKTPEKIAKLIIQKSPKLIFGLPSMWQVFIHFLNKKTPEFTAVVGGEVLSDTLAEKLFYHTVELWHAYGPTETTIWSTVYLIDKQLKKHIGQPIANTQCFVLDSHLLILPIGFPGQLCITGRGVFQGYLKAPDLTERALGAFSQEKIPCYKTGDIALWQETGVLDFIGRADKQVKIRGYRVELADIENVMEMHPKIQQCALAYRKILGKPILIAYYILKPRNWEERFLRKPKCVTKEALKKHCLTHRPAYMCPTAWVALTTFPKTPTGKIDKSALPDPDSSDFLILQQDCDQNVLDFTELHLKRLWKSVLPIKSFSVQDNFFEIGGDSLSSVTLTLLINKFFRTDYPVVWMFEHNSIRLQADKLKNDLVTQSSQSYTPLVCFNKGSFAKTLFLVHPGLAGAEVYDLFSQYVDSKLTLFGIDSFNLNAQQTFKNSIESLANFYVNAVLQHCGPEVYLAGWSLGGIIALEMAKQLAEKNILVKNLYLFDTYIVPPQHLEGLEKQVCLEVLKDVLPKKFVTHYARLPEAYLNRILASLKQDIKLFRDYTIPCYNGSVLLFKATEKIEMIDAWQFKKPYNDLDQFIQNIEVKLVAGNHFNLLEKPCVEKIARDISQNMLKND